MVQRAFSMLLRGLPGFVNSVFKLAQLLLLCFDYSCVSKRAQTVNITFKMKNKETTQHFIIDSTMLKVYGEGERASRKRGTDGKQ
ncbi:Mobile element protein [Candidatus Enterovibrio altilux]|uniref:Mobile element protein n=1 Tax=Candidatus Enterovibrio altilux TaxID=1927128 RepID=A0A291B737_9GAMM|nr:Mobile element protein [Candidatus Enterovibrio luxaltus]